MHKKLISVIMAAALALLLAVPALADTAPSAGNSATTDANSDALAKVTLAVKQTLGIDNSWKSFSGKLTDQGGYSYWNLAWQKDGGSLSVCADSSGKVLSYSLSDNGQEVNDYSSRYAPAFPKTAREDALKVAQSFVTKLLGKNETVSFSTYDTGYGASEIIYFWFDGSVDLNGLPSPVAFNVSVKASDLSVRNYYRSDWDGTYAPEIPSASAAVSADRASALLAAKLQLRLVYVLGSDGKTASLRYLPVYTGDFAVDAQTGSYVDLSQTDVYNGRKVASATDLAAAGKGDDGGLSPVEQTTVDGMKDVLTKDKLDAAARAVTPLGLVGAYTLTSAAYTMDSATGGVNCLLSYSEKITDSGVIAQRFPADYADMQKSGVINPLYAYKNVTLNAKTGALVSVNSYNTASAEQPEFSADLLRQKAESFLKTVNPDSFGQCAYNAPDSSEALFNFVYSQSVSSVLFPQNSLYVRMDAYDGSVNNYSCSWTQGLSFDPATGTISASDALKAYIGCYKTKLSYVGVPLSAKADPKVKPAKKLLLAYLLDSDRTVSAIDAKSGKPIYADSGSSAKKSYGDIAGCYGEAQIKKLASYGIGFDGADFKPTAQLTQKDALVLLLSATGNAGSNEDNLYQLAYSFRLLKPAEKDPAKLLTRLGFVKMLVGASDYGPAAALTGIYGSGFADESAIAAPDRGYVAIAKALGMVRGGANGLFNPNGAVSRQDAAIMLCAFMSR